MAVLMLGILLSVAMFVSTSTALEHPFNVAVNKTATQSSTFDGKDNYATPPLTYRASADLAVDDAPTKSYLDKTCAVTEWLTPPHCTDNPWWQVDLGGLYDVFNVTIYQRGEGKQTYGHLVVRVGNHVERPENRTAYSDRPVVSMPLSPPVTASTVNISIPGCAILQLCEVEVFAVRHVDECASNPCQHGGSCTDGVLNYSCACVPGYTGGSCETDINECASSPCQHGGSCRDLVGKFECVCLPGYTGTQCQTDINECASSPCKHGSCTDGVNSYTCTCQPGYTGFDCSQDIDECASSPCVQGATCHDYVNSYNCTCAAGFTGRNCEIDIDECASSSCSPCSVRSRCVDGINSFQCLCPVGYTGAVCDQTVMSAPSPAPSTTSGGSADCGGVACDNGGVCKMTSGGSTCVCSPGYSGLSCQSKCQTGWYGLECSQTCPSCQDGYSCHHVHGTCPPRDRLAEGVGIGLGVGLGAFLLLALGAFVLLRWKRRQKPSTEKASPNDLSMTSRQPVAVTRQQETGSRDQDAGHYESLDDATKDCSPPSPYSEVGEASREQEAASPYSNVAV